MVRKEEMHLGQRVLVGAEKRKGVIDALTQGWAWVLMDAGNWEFVDYAEMYVEEG